jgi:hypothetical protein
LNILIIGNGFDLAHGLKTSYSDFLNWCENKKIGKENIWIKHFLYMREHEDTLGKNWADFESEIYNVVHNIIYEYKNPNSDNEFVLYEENKRYFIDRYLCKKNTLEVSYNGMEVYEFIQKSNFITFGYGTIEELIEHLDDELSELTELFEKYLKEEIDYYEAITYIDRDYVYDKSKPVFNLSKILKKGQINFVLSFNYTRTLQELYWEYIEEKDIYYIHGELVKDNIVLGCKNFSEEEKIKELKNFELFEKKHQRLANNTNPRYKEFLEAINTFGDEIDTIYIIGHSLDDADKSIFEKLLLDMLPNAEVRINSYTRKSDKKITQNIIGILGGIEEASERFRLLEKEEIELKQTVGSAT